MQKEIKMTDKEPLSAKINNTKQQIPLPEIKTDILADQNKTILPSTENSTKPIEEKLKKKRIGLIISIGACIILLGIFLFYYFGIYKVKPYRNPSEVINLNNGYIMPNLVENAFAQVPIPTPLEPKTEESPINGKLFTKTEIKELLKRRPIAVMINNHAEARPQSGLNSADIVFETLAESGITRFMAIFWSEAPKKVGPIRSARQYYLEWLSPFDALFIHDGCADTDNPKTDACGNIHSYKIKDVSTVGAWRWNDGVRYAPHNEYSSLFTAWEYAEDRGWTGMPAIKSWKFKKDAPLDDRGQKTKVKIYFHKRLSNSGAYNSTWTYDIKTNSYYEEIGGKKLIDQETNTQVYTKNLIIQEVEYSPAYDDKGRIILTTIGEGKATYFIDGKITAGKWKKTSRTDRTTYYDNSGNEIQFNRGRTWISVIPLSIGKFDIIEQ